jgi:hypothetical protein
MVRSSSPVPQITIRPKRDAEAFVHKIADLRAEAHRQGYGTLAYFLETALREAIIQADQEAHDKHARTARPDSLWLPEA